MWKSVNGKLVHTTDHNRVKFRTRISAALLEQMDTLAKEHHTFPNYLLESGLENLLLNGTISYNKDLRPKDRIHYKTTYDAELLVNVKEFAKQNKLYINDVIEYSVNFIDFDNLKLRSHKYRIE